MTDTGNSGVHLLYKQLEDGHMETAGTRSHCLPTVFQDFVDMCVAL